MLAALLLTAVLQEPGKAITLDDYHPFEPPATLAAWEERAADVRRRVLVAAGLWPLPSKEPLDAIIHGRVRKDGYTVEKVSFRSWRGFYVTGNLYRPTHVDEGRHPGVLCPHGHWENGRFYERSVADAERQIEQGWESRIEAARYPLQARCAQLARMGCVVFHYDMVGFADSRQLGHDTAFRDAEAMLRLQSHFGLQTFNSIRALDFLTSLPDVDPERIGVTGASGGGTQTFILCAIDDRPKVALPAVMVSTAMQGGCICENAPHLRVGTGNVEIAALFAPKPLALTGANDWTIDIETKGLPQLKQVYGLYGAEENVTAKCWPDFEHNYNRHSRELMYSWFNRHLELGLEEPIVERGFEPLTPDELGGVMTGAHAQLAEGLDEESLRGAMDLWTNIGLADLVPENPEELAEYRRVVGGALETITSAALPAPDAVEIPAELTVQGAVAVVYLRGAENVHAHHDIEMLAGTVGVLVELSDESDPLLDARRHDAYAGYSFGYNPTLLARRVQRALEKIAWARELEGVESVRLLATGDSGPVAILALALAGDAVDRAACEWSWDFDDVKSLDDERMLPGGLRYGGMPYFAGLCAPVELRLYGIEEAPDVTRACYRAAGADGALTAVKDLDREELAAWLSAPPD